ncbi:U-box domain-containing protein 26 [Malania oleifera]|uniref:U-box domain-containing protein 26 n=1 Tax=Malania oleifera TaxID=397392 RepID=UPI0025AECD27|nr:U-box domain-containing protein 26 [Malania oleifera]
MKAQHSKLKTTPRPLFSCAFFRHCTQSALSPTGAASPPHHHHHHHLPLSPPTSHPPPPPPTPPPPPPPPAPPSDLQHQPGSGSSSSSTSQSFTQWKFSIPNSHLLHPPPQPPPPETTVHSHPPPPPTVSLQELFHIAELQLTSGSDTDRVSALHLLERSLVPNPPAEGGDEPSCPPAVMARVVEYLKDRVGAKAATKILLALCLAEGNRRVAVEVGAVGAAVEAMTGLDGPVAERALAALELMCTVAEGAAEVRAHALAVPMMVEMMRKMAARGREYAIGVLAVIFGGSWGEDGYPAPPEEVARAVAFALQGDCSARGRRKGAQLLKALQENGRLDLTQDGR